MPVSTSAVWSVYAACSDRRIGNGCRLKNVFRRHLNGRNDSGTQKTLVCPSSSRRYRRFGRHCADGTDALHTAYGIRLWRGRCVHLVPRRCGPRFGRAAFGRIDPVRYVGRRRLVVAESLGQTAHRNQGGIEAAVAGTTVSDDGFPCSAANHNGRTRLTARTGSGAARNDCRVCFCRRQAVGFG